MGYIIFIVIIGLWIWWKKTHYNDSPWVKNRIKNRTKEQQEVIRYFCNEPSCLSKKPISDNEYDGLIRNFVQSMDFKQKALNKLGLDEEQVKEIEPVFLEGFLFDNDALVKRGTDGFDRSSKYQISWLFFSDTQIYIYQYTFFLDEDGRKEHTEEYFYKDVTNFTTISDTQEVPQYNPKIGRNELINVNANRFAITVPGDKFYCPMAQNEYTESAIQGMKAKLREKKSAS